MFMFLLPDLHATKTGHSDGSIVIESMSNYQNIVKSEMKAGNGTDRFSQQLRTAIWSPGVRKASLTQRLEDVMTIASTLRVDYRRSVVFMLAVCLYTLPAPAQEVDSPSVLSPIDRNRED